MSSRNDRPPAPMPGAVRRLSWWFLMPLAVVVGATIARQVPEIWAMLSPPTRWVWLGIPVVCFTPVFVMILGVSRGLRRIRTAVTAAAGFACTNCLYDISGLGDGGVCPECGRRFDLALDRRSWARMNMV